jgi:hypothetical protein
MQSMQIVLKNNRKLSGGRKKRGFFKRELSYSQVCKYYKDSSIPLTDVGIEYHLTANKVGNDY